MERQASAGLMNGEFWFWLTFLQHLTHFNHKIARFAAQYKCSAAYLWLYIAFFGKTPIRRFCLICWASVMFVCSFDTKFALEYAENRLTYNHQILHGHPYRHSLQPHLIWHIIFFRSKVIAKKKTKKYRLRWLRVEFLENSLSEDHEILQLIQDRRPHKPAWYDITNCFWSAAKCN